MGNGHFRYLMLIALSSCLGCDAPIKSQDTGSVVNSFAKGEYVLQLVGRHEPATIHLVPTVVDKGKVYGTWAYLEPSGPNVAAHRFVGNSFRPGKIVLDLDPDIEDSKLSISLSFSAETITATWSQWSYAGVEATGDVNITVQDREDVGDR